MEVYQAPLECKSQIDNILSPTEHARIHWDNPEHRQEQSERLKKIRASKFWSSKPRV